MRIKPICFLLVALLLLSSAALADWTAPDANLAQYTDVYAEVVEGYRLIKYGATGTHIATLKESLATLGYFPYRASENYYRTLETAIRLFTQQMRLGGDGQTITPLMQAMIADASHLPKALCPVLDLSSYSWQEEDTGFTAYTYARLTRTSVLEDTQVGFFGKITVAEKSGETYYYTIALEDDAQKHVYVAYQPLPRTTVYQAGDAVAVFGTTQGEQALPYPGMDTAALYIKADRIGYDK
jgi:hypothetical protein